MTEFLTIQEVQARIKLGRTTIFKMLKKGTFPQPVRINCRVSRWPADVIESWQNEQIDKAAPTAG